MKYNKDINKENIRLFKRYLMLIPDDDVFKCVICESRCSISTSYSNRGNRLICHECFWKFKSIKDARDFIDEDEKDLH